MQKIAIPLKDQLFNREKVHKIACEIKSVYEEFDKHSFQREVLEKFPFLELKERIYHIRDELKTHLPDDFQTAVKILLDSLPQELDSSKSDDDFGDFIYAPFGEYISLYGCSEENVDFSLMALGEITKRFSVEMAIRDFINSFEDKTLQMLKEYSFSHNYHQRRLSSEALRPKLPWAKKIDIDYKTPISILDNLYSDKTRFVTRSVANHLNDISKIDPSLVIDTLKRWQKTDRQAKKEMEFIINHSLRTLIKTGDKKTMEFLGYRQNPSIKIDNFSLANDKIVIGEALEFCFDIKAEEKERLIVDYIIHFKTKNGSLSPKVHKLKKLEIEKDGSINISKNHPFKANMTTRKLYLGAHKIELQINGKVYTCAKFDLI